MNISLRLKHPYATEFLETEFLATESATESATEFLATESAAESLATEFLETECATESYERASSLEQGCRQVLESAHLGVSGGYLGVRKPASFEKSFPSKR